MARQSRLWRNLALGAAVAAAVLVAVLVAHAVATCLLAGVVWVVQLVVYPGFLAVGPTSAWPAFHASHSRGMTLVVAVPWAVEGAALAVLLLRRPAGVPTWLVLLAAALGLATVVVTLGVSVPLHERLGAGFASAYAAKIGEWQARLRDAGRVVVWGSARRALPSSARSGRWRRR